MTICSLSMNRPSDACLRHKERHRQDGLGATLFVSARYPMTPERHWRPCWPGPECSKASLAEPTAA